MFSSETTFKQVGGSAESLSLSTPVPQNSEFTLRKATDEYGIRVQSSVTRSCSALLPGWMLANAVRSKNAVLESRFSKRLFLGIGLSIRKNLNMLSKGMGGVQNMFL